MNLTIDLPDEQIAILAAQARARGLSAEEYARQLLEQDLLPMAFQSLGLFGESGDATLLDELVSIAFERRRQT